MSSSTKSPYEVIIRPILTEKSVNVSNAGKYVFAVKNDANKYEIASAIEQIQKEAKNDIHVVEVNTINVKGHQRQGRFFRRANKGRTADWKKAIITLEAGQTIEIVEGV